MKYKTKIATLSLLAITTITVCGNAQQEPSKSQSTVAANPLASWNDRASKKAIIDFITRTTNEGNKDFVPLSDRIACFDNDGTLWSEQPIYIQFAFALDRVKATAAQHPEWKTTQPFQAVLEGDIKTALSGGEKALMQIMAATHSGMSTDEFEKIVKDWFKTATHPKTRKHYNEMAYKPMVELLNYLRSNGYKTFIVSGGGVDFMRVIAEHVYGIPSHQVIGSSGKVKYEMKDGKPVLVKLADLNFYDDKEGKPVAIHQYIGKRPVFTAGNSDGDYAMLQWTSTGSGPRFGMIVHHTDPTREWEYDRASSIGHLEKALDDAATFNWLIVDMKKDWKEVFAK